MNIEKRKMMKRKIILYVIILIVIIVSGYSVKGQRSPYSNEKFVSGYVKKITSNEIKYSSGIIGLDQAMITRANTGKQKMVWETGMISTKKNKDKITYLHYIGYDSKKPGTIFNFYKNGIKQGEIALPNKEVKKWTIKLKDNQRLDFTRIYVDGNHDVFGYLYYTIPSKYIELNKPLKLELTGASEKKLAWMMVFKKNFSPTLKVVAMPSIINSKGKRYQSLIAEINHLNVATKGKLFVNGKFYKKIPIKTGVQSVEILYPVIKKESELSFLLDMGSHKMNATEVIRPVKKWSIDFIQHTHTDIGYTRTQMEILAEHLRYIDYALDYCDATDHLPDHSKFRWTCEASWAVDEYLNSRSESQIKRLRQRIKEGRIEVTGMYFNFNELPDEQSLAASLAPIKNITDKGIPVTSVMQNDVNGIAWCMNDYFNSLDIKYLNMGTHGHKALISFDTPLAFWWVSPSGKKMLAFRAEHYMLGNSVFGIHLEDFSSFEKNVLQYLNLLNARGYPYDKIAIQHSGFLTDNSPPSMLSSEMIRKWNEKYEWPKLRTSIVSDFFKKLESQYGDELQEIKAHWPDWWTDGVASGAREVAAVRNAHVDLITAQGGLSMAKLLGSKMPKGVEGRITETNKALLFYGEHTLGAAESISDPYGKSTMEQREIKESFAWEAARRSKMLNEEALGLLNDYIGKDTEASMVVYNTLNWSRDGLITLFIDHQQVPWGKKIRLLDEKGNKYPAQILKPWLGGSYWAIWVKDIPAFGYKKFIIEVYEHKHDHKHKKNAPHEHNNLNYVEKGDFVQMDNAWYSVKVNKKKGHVEQIYDKDIGKNLLDTKSKFKLGEFILEKLGGREQLQNIVLPNGSRFGHLTDYTRHPLDSIWLTGINKGEVWNTISFKGKTRTAYDAKDAFSFKMRMFNTTKRIDFAYELKKKPIVRPESFYIAFPFELNDGKINLEVAGGTIEAGVDQILGSSNDWNAIQNFVRVNNNKEQIVLVSPEAPMMQFGNINTGRFKYGATPESNHLFSWPMNNYWTTNFNADQRGMYTWKYHLTSMNNDDNEKATKFSWGARVPFLARVIPKSPFKKKGVKEMTVLSGIPNNILMVNAKPLENENAIIFHFREIGGVTSSFVPKYFNNKTYKWFKTNVLGQEAEEVKSLKIAPLESSFFKLMW